MSDRDSSFAPDDPAASTATPYADRHLANIAAALHHEQHPAHIGPYEVVALVAEGGMGTVYRAEQHEPIRRTVAIKVIRFGMDTRAVLARFESERRALAMMDHPNVARVLDAGITERGRSYFVMEFVDGTPITSFADEHRLTLADRLRLLAQACAAVRHAHQKAIIHRDIKPSNILVARRDDGTDVVKVIDFGVAKAIAGSDAGRPLVTEVDQRVGTPEYMSPEQADGDRDVDTRTDVYSLGVVLYELLSGSLPFASDTLRQASYGELCRIIREVDPPRPSARLARSGPDATAIADRRRAAPAALAARLRSELDWIVVKALRKDRDRRYASPDELAQDIENYLASRPLRAGPESVAYRARKFARRNRAAVFAAAASTALLLGGIAATSWQATRATRAERATRLEQSRTLAEQAKAEAANAATGKVNAFLVDMLQSVDPGQAQGKPVLVRDLLDRAAATVGTELAGQPKAQAEVRAALGSTYAGLGLHARADEHLTAAWQLQRRLEGDDSRAALRAELRLVGLRIAQDELDDAHAITNGLLERCRRHLGENDELTGEVKAELAVIYESRGDAAQAERMFREAIAAGEAAGRQHTAGHLINVGNLGQMLRPLGRLDEAEPLTRAAYEGMVRLKGADDPTAIDMSGVYADVLRMRGDLPEAERLMRDNLERALRVYGPDHSRSIMPEQGLAIVLEVQGKKPEALAHFRGALARVRRVMGDDHSDTLYQITSIAASRFLNGDHAEAERLFLEARDGWTRTGGPDHPNVVIAAHGLTQTYLARDKPDAALSVAKALYDQLRDPTRIQIVPAKRARYLSSYGITLAKLGRLDEAREPLTIAHAALAETAGRNRNDVDTYATVVRFLAEIDARAGDDPARAAHWHRELARFAPPDATPATAPTTTPATASRG